VSSSGVPRSCWIRTVRSALAGGDHVLVAEPADRHRVHPVGVAGERVAEREAAGLLLGRVPLMIAIGCGRQMVCMIVMT